MKQFEQLRVSAHFGWRFILPKWRVTNAVVVVIALFLPWIPSCNSYGYVTPASEVETNPPLLGVQLLFLITAMISANISEAGTDLLKNLSAIIFYLWFVGGYLIIGMYASLLFSILNLIRYNQIYTLKQRYRYWILLAVSIIGLTFPGPVLRDMQLLVGYWITYASLFSSVILEILEAVFLTGSRERVPP